VKTAKHRKRGDESTQREDDHVTGMIYLQANEYQQMPSDTRYLKRQEFSLRVIRVVMIPPKS
jgi:hypothetical protein